MSKKKRVLWLIGIILIYALVAIIGFVIVFLIKNAMQPHIQQRPIPTPPLPKATSVPITPPSNWKTYTNPQAKVKLSYPSDLKEKDTSYGLGVSTVELRSEDNTDSDNAPDYQLLIVPKTIAKAIGQDFDEYYAMSDNETKVISSPLSQSKAKQNFTKLDNRDIRGHKAVDYRSTSTDAKPDDEAEIGTMIENGDKLILISTGESNKAELEKVISTLTF